MSQGAGEDSRELEPGHAQSLPSMWQEKFQHMEGLKREGWQTVILRNPRPLRGPSLAPSPQPGMSGVWDFPCFPVAVPAGQLGGWEFQPLPVGIETTLADISLWCRVGIKLGIQISQLLPCHVKSLHCSHGKRMSSSLSDTLSISLRPWVPATSLNLAP